MQVFEPSYDFHQTGIHYYMSEVVSRLLGKRYRRNSKLVASRVRELSYLYGGIRCWGGQGSRGQGSRVQWHTIVEKGTNGCGGRSGEEEGVAGRV